jgi:hypothetical protein
MTEEKRSSNQKVKAMDALYQDWAKRCFVTKKRKVNKSTR